MRKWLEQFKPWCVAEITHDGVVILSRHWTKADAVITAPPREHIMFLRVSAVSEANRTITESRQCDEV